MPRTAVGAPIAEDAFDLLRQFGLDEVADHREHHAVGRIVAVIEVEDLLAGEAENALGGADDRLADRRAVTYACSKRSREMRRPGRILGALDLLDDDVRSRVAALPGSKVALRTASASTSRPTPRNGAASTRW